MKFFKIAMFSIGLLVLLAVLIVGMGGVLLSRNLDSVAEAAVDASGIKAQIAKQGGDRCRMAREQFDALWNEAVDSGTFEAREPMLHQAEAAVKATCSSN